MEIVMIGGEILRRALCRFGHYVFVEIVMPGGNLLALLIYLYRRQAIKSGSPAMSISRAADRL